MFTFYDMNRHEVQGNKNYDNRERCRIPNAYALATLPNTPGDGVGVSDEIDDTRDETVFASDRLCPARW